MLIDGGPMNFDWAGYYQGTCGDCGYKTRLIRLEVRGNTGKSPRFENCPRCDVQMRWKQDRLPEGIIPVFEEEEIYQGNGPTINLHVLSVIGRLARLMGISHFIKKGEKGGV
jgi:hypothetical protein